MSEKLKILITGVSGLLGGTLADLLRADYSVTGMYLNHPVQIPNVKMVEGNILSTGYLNSLLKEVQPDIVIHCASLTNVDECETKKTTASQVNIIGTRHLASVSNAVDAKFIYISTDSVYGGDKGNYAEDDAIEPRNHYGHTKYQGEKEALKGIDALILRTNIFGWNIMDKLSLGEWILERLERGVQTNGFTDAEFSTIYTYELARVIEMAIRHNLSGIYNCGSRDTCSKYDFICKIADKFGFDTAMVSPSSIDNSNLKAERGRNLSLDVHKLEGDLQYTLPTIDASIDRFYRDYHSKIPERLKRYQENRKCSIGQGFIQYGRQWINEKDIDSVLDVLRSSWITQGPTVREFEETMTDYCGAKYSVAVNSGTSALHIACLAAGLQSKDEIVTSPITFVASANCAVYCGAVPRFCDIDVKTYNMSPEALANCITEKTRIVIPVHFAGQSCDMETIRQIVDDAAKNYGHKIYLLEDASHAIGSRYKDTSVGSCQFADMAVTSFHPVKHITTGEGGMVFCNDGNLYSRMIRLRSHGISSSPEDFINREQAFDGNHDIMNPWYYEQLELGFNYRITDIQCALGRSQLKRIESFRKRRREIVDRYNVEFAQLPHILTPHETNDNDSNFHLYVLQIDFEAIGATRRQVMESLKTKGIQTQVHYIPVHTQPYYQNHFGFKWGDFPVAEAYYRRCLSIPLYPAMDDDDTQRVIDAITELVRR